LRPALRSFCLTDGGTSRTIIPDPSRSPRPRTVPLALTGAAVFLRSHFRWHPVFGMRIAQSGSPHFRQVGSCCFWHLQCAAQAAYLVFADLKCWPLGGEDNVHCHPRHPNGSAVSSGSIPSPITRDSPGSSPTTARRQPLLWGPPTENGCYDWAAARATRRDVDLALPSSTYSNARDGPCHLEIHVFLLSRRSAYRGKNTAGVLPPTSSPKTTLGSASTWAREFLGVVARKLGMRAAPLREAHNRRAVPSVRGAASVTWISASCPTSVPSAQIVRKRTRLARLMPIASLRAASPRRNSRRPR